MNQLEQSLEKQKNLILLTDGIIVKKVIDEIDHIKLKNIPTYIMEAAQLKTVNHIRLDNINQVLEIGKTFITTKERIDNKTFQQ